MKPALLIIDMQNAFYFLNPKIKESFDAAAGTINAALKLFREKNLPVFFIQQIDEKEGLTLDKEGFKIIEQIQALPSDLFVKKHRGSAFFGTKLDELLKEEGIDTLILTGFCAEYCVLSTYRSGSDLDYTPIMLRNALASEEPENILFVERISSLIPLEVLAKVLG